MTMFDRCMLMLHQGAQYGAFFACDGSEHLLIDKHSQTLKFEGTIWPFIENPSQSYGALPAV